MILIISIVNCVTNHNSTKVIEQMSIEKMSDNPRDEATGQFAKGQVITPEHRAKMQAAKAAKHGLAQELLESVGLDWDSAPPELAILAKKAASGAIPAMRLFLSQTKQLVHKDRVVSKGEVINIVLSQETTEYLLEHGVKFKLCPRCERLSES